MATRQTPTRETFVLDSLSPKTYKIHLYVSPTLLLYSYQATGLYLLLYDFFSSVFVSPFETELLFASCWVHEGYFIFSVFLQKVYHCRPDPLVPLSAGHSRADP